MASARGRHGKASSIPINHLKGLTSILLCVWLGAATLTACVAELKVSDPGTGELVDKFPATPILLQGGASETSATVLYTGDELPTSALVKAVAKSDFGLWSADEVVSNVVTDAAGSEKVVNYTLPFVFEEGVGLAQWAFVVEFEDGSQEFIEGQYIVAGVVAKQDGKLVSGDDRVYETTSSTTEFDLEVTALDGSDLVDLETLEISVFDAKTGKTVESDKVDVSTSQQGTLEVKYSDDVQVGDKYTIELVAPEIEFEGEVFETELNLAVKEMPSDSQASAETSDAAASAEETKEAAPEVPSGAEEAEETTKEIPSGAEDGSSSAGETTAETSDEETPAGASDTGGKTGSADPPAQGTEPSDSGNTTAGATGKVLAKDSLEDSLEPKDGKEVVLSLIRIVPADPSTYLLQSAGNVLDAVCHFTQGSDCSMVNVTKGSAIVHVENYVAAESFDASVEALEGSILDCDFQDRVGTACENVELASKVVKRADDSRTLEGNVSKSRSGPPVWLIATSSIAGAVALVAAVIAALWLVHRKSEEQNESDFSSSGPMGVPEPDNMLYQQAIVRDIYGRGDFSSGALTEEAAETRRKDVERMEAAQRPPSSSVNLTVPTDDASSTYSV